MKAARWTIAIGVALIIADLIGPGPAPDGVTALGLTLAGMGLAFAAIERSPR